MQPDWEIWLDNHISPAIQKKKLTESAVSLVMKLKMTEEREVKKSKS